MPGAKRHATAPWRLLAAAACDGFKATHLCLVPCVSLHPPPGARSHDHQNLKKG